MDESHRLRAMTSAVSDVSDRADGSAYRQMESPALRRRLVTTCRQQRYPDLSADGHRHDRRVSNVGAAWGNEQALTTVDEQPELLAGGETGSHSNQIHV